MNKNSLFCCGWWPFVVLPLISLLFALILYWRNIEADVAANTQQTLAENDHQWASVDTRNNGRNVVLAGGSTERKRS